MATATATKESKKATSFDGEYVAAVGRRKTAVARVRLYKMDGAEDADLRMNDKTVSTYCPTPALVTTVIAPLELVGMKDKFGVSVIVRGGGPTGQAEAARLGIARALVKFDEGLRPALKSAGFLRRDPRVVERKKPGLKKARRAPQWSKR